MKKFFNKIRKLEILPDKFCKNKILPDKFCKNKILPDKFCKNKIFKRHKFLILVCLVFVITGCIGLVLFVQDQRSQKTSAAIITPTPAVTNYPKVEKYRVPILMYHYIRTTPETDKLGTKLSVSPADFENQIKWLKEENFDAIHAADLADPDKKEISRVYAEGKKPLVITFDDGYKDAYINAFPILNEYQFTATFYVIRDKIGQPNYLSQDEIDKLGQTGMEIGSHTLSHPDLTKVSIYEARRQIFGSKQDTQVFCYPSGKFNPIITGFVEKAGYLDAVTTNEGIADQNSSLFELPRIRMSNTPFDKLKEKIDGTKTI